jgi:hypothetical protein
MIELANASINSFSLGAPSPALLGNVLQELQALNEQAKNFREEIAILEKEVELLQEKRETDRATIARLQFIMDLYINPDPRVFDASNEDFELLVNAIKRRVESAKEYGCRILDLEDHVKEIEGIKPAQAAQRDRGEILRALIAAHGGKMLAKDARLKMRLDKATFSRLLDTQRDLIEFKQYHNDKRKLLLILK